MRAIEGTGARILDTRKTTPGLRALEKAAVAAGGATNHRAGLYDAILIKENHAALAGGVGEAVRRARAHAPDLPLEVECRDLAEVDEALAAGAPRLLLDNMSPAAAARGGGARGGPRRARGQRGSDAPDAQGGREHGRRLRLGGRADPQRAGPRSLPPPEATAMNLPMLSATEAPLMLENIPALQDEVRELAAARGAVILAHNYQLPEIQDVADYVGDSLGLSQQAAASDAGTIAFCGVHFMAETASILCPDKAVLIPDPDAGCSLADSITAAQLRDWKAQHPDARSWSCTSTRPPRSRPRPTTAAPPPTPCRWSQHIYATHGEDTEILFGPDMFLGAYVEKTLGRSMHVWDGECHVHAGIKPADITSVREAHPSADFLIHPECGCSTSVMEYVASGDIASQGVHMLSTGGMLGLRPGAGVRRPAIAPTAIVATETGMLHPLRQAAPDVEFIAANEAASCRFMKMITLPKLRDALRDGVHEVKVPAEIADRARVPIERMVAIS